ncbi:MAG TPA: homocysteine biosynthesis protein [Candidatus Edwardsbacteria bacterium]|nr:homocysteine biosynthesis protein [Candidatus Edwardsbacteria bacterium]
MAKTLDQINQRIERGEALVLTAEEVIGYAAEHGTEQAARDVDVVTTGTFGPMCSSGAYFNLGHSRPRIKLGGGTALLNGVPAYTGLAAADVFLGATAAPADDPGNRFHPGEFRYGGGHVIEDLVSGKKVRLVAAACGTDCYPRRAIEALIGLDSINEAVLFNPRNCYQNYNVAVNRSDRTIHTYMGVLRPQLANATYSSAGQLSPLLNDPYCRSTGIGTKIFLGGGIGYVAWPGTQFNPDPLRGENGVPKRGGATLAVIGDLKQMSPRFLAGMSMLGYGATLAVGIGVPIPILSEEILRHTLVTDADILAPVVDYSSTYPERGGEVLAEVSYAELRSGRITVGGKTVPTAPLSSLAKAREIAQTLKQWITSGKFELTAPVAPLPAAGSLPPLKPLNEAVAEVRP